MPDSVKIAGLSAILTSVALPIGLVLDELVVEGQKLTVTGPPFDLHMPQAGKMTVTVKEAALAAFLNKKAPGGLKDFVVRVATDGIHIQATAVVLVPITAKAVCTLRIQAERELWVDLVSVDVAGIGGKSLVQGQINQINPVLDMSEFPVQATLQSVLLEAGVIRLIGTVMPV